MAESVFGKPIDNAIQEINDKIGTVPSGETVEGQIDALNSNIAPVAITVTAASGVTINDRHVYRVGKIVCVNVSVTIGNTAISSTDNIITGLPAPIVAVFVVGCKNLGGGNSQAMLTTGGELRNNWDSFEAGKKYFFNFCYATA